MTCVILSLHSQMLKSGQTFKIWSNNQLWSNVQRLVKQGGF